MVTKINLEKLKELIKAFYNLTGIKSAVYDSEFQEILAYPKANSEFCSIMHKNKVSSKGCFESTRRLCEKCAEKNELIFEKCHAGLTEVIAPLTDGNAVIGYIMFGQFRNDENKEVFLQSVLKNTEKYNINTEQLTRAASKIRYYSNSNSANASKILDALATYIVSEKLVYFDANSIGLQIVEYIRNNTEKNLSVASLCEKFYLSKSALYKITKSLMPEGVARFIKKTRLEKAAYLLRYTDKSLMEITEEIGFSDIEYFLRVFKKEKGMNVTKYRYMT